MSVKKKWILFKILGLWILIVTNCYALPFTIVPTTTLPTSVVLGSSVMAYYTVTNGTGSTRANNYVEYLPPNVIQVETAGPYSPICGSTFALAPNGSAGDSCILELKVSGAVDSADPDQTHHLFVCFPGGRTCAGTFSPLNVTQSNAALLSIAVIPVSPTILVGSTQQFTAEGTYADGSVGPITTAVQWASSNPSVATISSTGLATGVTAGTTNITATQGGITSPIDVATVAKRVVSIAITPLTASLLNGSTGQFTATATFSDSSTGNISSLASWNSSNPNIATINSTGLATGVSGIGTPNTTNISASYQGITSTAPAVVTVNFYAYFSTSANDSIGTPGLSTCLINNTNGTTSGCNVVNSSASGIRAPNNSVANTTSTILFSTSQLNGLVSGCAITNNSGSISISSSCTYSIPPTASYGIVLDQTGSHAYVANNTNNNVQVCTVSGSSLSCGSTTGLSSPEGLAFNPSFTVLYAATSGGIFFCTITSPGVIGACSNAGGSNISSPSAVAITSDNKFAFIGNGRSPSTAGTVVSCPITTGGGFSSPCTIVMASSNFNSGVFGVAIDPTGTYFYAVDFNSHAFVCPIMSGGTLGTCTGIATSLSNVTGVSVH